MINYYFEKPKGMPKNVSIKSDTKIKNI